MRNALLITSALGLGLQVASAQSLQFTSGGFLADHYNIGVNIQGPTNTVCWLQRLSITNNTWSTVATYTLSSSGSAFVTNSLDGGWYGIFRTQSTNGVYQSTNGFGALRLSLVGLNNLVGNPFAANTISNLFPIPLEDMNVYKWINPSGPYTSDSFSGGIWDDPLESFAVGEGLWVTGPKTNSVISFQPYGVFKTNETVALPSGISFVTPTEFRFWSYPPSNLQVDQFSGTNTPYGGRSGFPVQTPGFSPQCKADKYNYTTNGLAEYQFTAANAWQWSGTNATIPLSLAEGFFLNKPTNGVWTILRSIW